MHMTVFPKISNYSLKMYLTYVEPVIAVLAQKHIIQRSSLCEVTAPALVSAIPILISNKPTGMNVNMVPSDTEEDNTEGEASTASITQPAQQTPTMPKTPPQINQLPASGDKENKLAAAAGKVFVYKIKKGLVSSKANNSEKQAMFSVKV